MQVREALSRGDVGRRDQDATCVRSIEVVGRELGTRGAIRRHEGSEERDRRGERNARRVEQGAGVGSVSDSRVRVGDTSARESAQSPLLSPEDLAAYLAVPLATVY